MSEHRTAHNRWILRATIGAAALWMLIGGVPWPQTVRVRLSRGPSPVVGAHVKVVHYGGFASCDAEGVAGRTDHSGAFTGRRWKLWALADRLTVLVQMDTVCVDEGTGWRPIWSVPYGPAARELLWVCDLSRPARTDGGPLRGICELRTSELGQVRLEVRALSEHARSRGG